MDGPKEGRAEAEQSWRLPKKWTHSSCVQKWESRRERGSRGAVLARCSFRSIALLAPIGNGVGLLVQVQSMRFKSDTRKGD